MASRSLTLAPAAPAKMSYASALRCLGQVLQEMDLKAAEVKTHGDDFIVRAWNKGTSLAMDAEKHYTQEDIRKINAAGRQARKPFGAPPDLLSLSHILRLAGNYVDRLGGRLMRVCWQDQSDRIQAITLQWQPIDPGHEGKESAVATVEELSMHIYKQRKKINLASERDAHRPFVHVPRPF